MQFRNINKMGKYEVEIDEEKRNDYAEAHGRALQAGDYTCRSI